VRDRPGEQAEGDSRRRHGSAEPAFHRDALCSLDSIG
jgi:hypothetical protein